MSTLLVHIFLFSVKSSTPAHSDANFSQTHQRLCHLHPCVIGRVYHYAQSFRFSPTNTSSPKNMLLSAYTPAQLEATVQVLCNLAGAVLALLRLDEICVPRGDLSCGFSFVRMFRTVEHHFSDPFLVSIFALFVSFSTRCFTFLLVNFRLCTNPDVRFDSLDFFFSVKNKTTHG